MGEGVVVGLGKGELNISSLFSSSTKARLVCLYTLEESLSKNEVEDKFVLSILKLLFRTYPSYCDRRSRRAVLRCVQWIFKSTRAPEVLEEFGIVIRLECLKHGIAPANAFVLVEWCCAILEQIINTNHWSFWGLLLIEANSNALQLCVKGLRRPLVKKAALTLTRRALRKIFSTDTQGHILREIVKTLCSKSSESKIKNAVMLGIIAGVSARDLNTKKLLESIRSEFYDFYIREVLGSRVQVPPYISISLEEFFSNFALKQDLDDVLLPALEKALLRAPEIVLNDLLTSLIRSLPPSIDLSIILHINLLKPLLSNAKSTNPITRAGALSTFQAAILKCYDTEIKDKIFENILAPLLSGKSLSVDQRAKYAEMLASISVSKDKIPWICQKLALVASKETNEIVLIPESSTLLHFLTQAVLNGEDIDNNIIMAVVNGISDKKPSIKKTWILFLGDFYHSLNEDVLLSPVLDNLTISVLPPILITWKDAITSPIAAVQSGLLSSAYVFASIVNTKLVHIANTKVKYELKQVQLKDHVLKMEPKPSFLLNPRIFGKLNNDIDFLWFIRALITFSGHVISMEAESAVAIAWSQAIIFSICSSAIKIDVQREAISQLSKLYHNHPARISQLIVAGLWQWLRALELEEKDSAAIASKTANKSLYRVVYSICPSSTEQSKIIRQKQMISLLVLCRPELIPKTNWINMCIRLNVDPGELAQSSSEALINEILQHSSFDVKSSTLAFESARRASFNAAADLAFVAPQKMVPEIMSLIERDLDPKQLSDIGPTEAGIFHTEDGSAYVDILASKTNLPDLNKKTKDYDTIKWEIELKDQLAKKNGEKKKLSPEENAKVMNQIRKEDEIRQKLRSITARIQRGAGIICNLVVGPPTDASLWMSPVIKYLLAIIDSSASLITGDVISNAYISCSQKLPSRLGEIRSFIGIAALRAMEFKSLQEIYSQEPLGTLISRVLYRLRFSGEQMPFDVVSLSYIIPLIVLVLRNGGYGSKEDADTQLVLALEFLSLHTEACSDTRAPRENILIALIESMQIYNQHYKIIKDCLADLCRCIAPNITNSEIGILLRGIIVPQKPVRTSVLQSINSEIDLSELEYSDEVLLACHDEEEENVLLGREIWEESNFKLTEATPFRLLGFLKETDFKLRKAAAKSVAEAVRNYPEAFPLIVQKLKSTYQELAKPCLPKLNEYGIPIKTEISDPWQARHGFALAFKELAPQFRDSILDSFLRFLIKAGPLGDRNLQVRKEMIDAAVLIIALNGKNEVEDLMKTLEETLEGSNKSSELEDHVNEAVVIIYGAVTRHLNNGDVRVPIVVNRLLETLSTPSEAVQYAVAECLPPLVRVSVDRIQNYVQYILDRLFNSKDYAGRRGAAYGLAGIVHGSGLYALREYRILSMLQAGIENKKKSTYREGAFLAYELLSTILSGVFEPYVIELVPQLLTGFGDVNSDVRESCLAAAKACFARLSSFGVKRILPTLLEGLEDSQWRSKRGACDLLGAMAYLNPQQLAQSLPEIIPPLTCVLNDSHKEVRLAANRSLKRFGEAIINPEIKSLVDVLLKALCDPTKYTDFALDSLIKVSFVHYLDAPSLALVVRILERGLGDRSATKRKASQVIGSLAHLTERKDLISHLPILVSGLKIAMVDPVPTTRATASKALGSLIEKLGEDALPDLIPGLMQTLKSDTGAGDRLGSAQALSEVLAGLGTSRLDDTLPTILQNASSSKPEVREGFISLFIFLPVCFGNSFANYLSKIIPLILQGLADDLESIRETSLRAGRLLVKNFSTRSVELLLPELERGLADDNYRIRLSSTELTGDLLFNLTGIKAETEQDEEESYKSGAASVSLLEILGEERRNKVLSALYICRCDTSGLVRTAATGVWKALVPTPKILKELIPTLTRMIVDRLGSSLEQKEIAGNALSELVRKAGDGLLPNLLPVLEEGLKSNDANSKQGICIALRELIGSASIEALDDHETTLISVVRTALIDSDKNVRETAAEAFDSLQQLLGKRAVDQVLPYLLNLLRSGAEAENALSALLTLLTETTRSSIILPSLIPTLITSPISLFNSKALASLATVAGSTMTRKLPIIMNALMDNIIHCEDSELRTELEASFHTVIMSVDEFDGLNTSMSVLMTLVKHQDHRKRAITGHHLAKFFEETTIDFSRFNQDIIRTLLILFDDRDIDVSKAAWIALNEFTKHLKKEEMENLVFSTRKVLQQVGVAGANLPGFSIPKGVNAILPIFLHSLMNGNAEQRIQSALAISDIVDRTSEDSLKPFVSQITGPLIRVVSERSIDLKSAALFTLNNLLGKIPTLLKPFLPQLQRTFAKCLADTSSEILRKRAALALGTLITLIPRVDPLIAELCTGVKTSDLGVKVAIMKALYEVVSKAGSKINDTSRASISNIIKAEPEDDNLPLAIINAKLLAVFTNEITPRDAADLIKNHVLKTSLSLSSVLAINALLLESPSSLLECHIANDLPSIICKGMTCRDNIISDNYVLASGKYLLSEIRTTDFETLKLIFETLANLLQPGNSADTRRLSLVVIRTVCRYHRNIIRPHLALLAFPVFTGTRDTLIPVKLAAEAAFMVLFDVVNEESKAFDKFVASQEFPTNQKKVMQDYFKRVTLRLGKTEKERKEADGGVNSLGLSNDEVDDEKEIWSIGRVELDENSFDD
ncbi:eIF-2-alpha kinase activator GCN1 [Erysiphe neolycopersici]|uniref:eIF-2-alpha kinase activator GCN1 n=1 Tax=Erysiphe neolycopersici TaxID=212602 RepID=A0A420HYN6_9PEZI|nr:eIF-2-alpha kinase activator GCN1 [Erysiphe neolycopersici]